METKKIWSANKRNEKWRRGRRSPLKWTGFLYELKPVILSLLCDWIKYLFYSIWYYLFYVTKDEVLKSSALPPMTNKLKKKKKWYLVTWSNRFGGSGSGWELFSNPSSIVTSNRHDNVIPVVLTNQNGIEERQKIPIKNFLDNISTQVLRLFKVFLKLLL